MVPGEGWSEAGRRAGQRLSDLKSMPRGQGAGPPPVASLEPSIVRARRAMDETRLCAPNTAGSGAPRSPRSRMTSRSSLGTQVSVTIVAVIPARAVPSGHQASPPQRLPPCWGCLRPWPTGPWLPGFTVSSAFALPLFSGCLHSS